jgi:hypothetical protein
MSLLLRQVQFVMKDCVVIKHEFDNQAGSRVA